MDQLGIEGGGSRDHGRVNLAKEFLGGIRDSSVEGRCKLTRSGRVGVEKDQSLDALVRCERMSVEGSDPSHAQNPHPHEPDNPATSHPVEDSITEGCGRRR